MTPDPSNIVPLPTAPKVFVAPTIEECLDWAKHNEMPDAEAYKFFYYYTANGWHCGRTKMQVWRAAMAGWNCRYERNMAMTPGHAMTGADKMIMLEKLKRVEKKIDQMRNNQPMRPAATDADFEIWKREIGRLKEIRNDCELRLGLKI